MKISVKCKYCGKFESIDVDEKQYENWKSGMKIQDAMPDKGLFVREALISSTCFDCISKIFNTPKPGEDWGEQLTECGVCGCPIYKKDNLVCPQCGETVPFEDESDN